MANSRTSIPVGGGTLPAQWFAPPSPDAPTIVVCQEIFGVTDYIRRRCRDLNALGYGVLAPEFYWRLAADGEPSPEINEAGPGALERAFSLLQQTDFDLAIADGAAAVTQVAQRAPAVGLVGFCFGGGLAFGIAARTEPAALVSYYGSALPTMLELAPQVTAPSLHHFGDADSFIDAQSQVAIREAVTGTGAQWISHPGADHAFDNDIGPWHHADAAASAWQSTVEFLGEHLPVSSGD